VTSGIRGRLVSGWMGLGEDARRLVDVRSRQGDRPLQIRLCEVVSSSTVEEARRLKGILGVIILDKEAWSGDAVECTACGSDTMI
jgi:hypothetical protein